MKGRSPKSSSRACAQNGGIMTLDDLKNYRAIVRARRARHLSRLRHRLDAAALLGRRAPDRDAQHPRRLPAARDRRGVRRDPAPDDRGDEARLCGPRRIPRRSGLRQGPGRGPHLEALRRRAAQGDRSGARAARARRSAPAIRRPTRATTPRISRWSTRDGNAVANTYTLNFFYGLGLVAEGTGILLNNELDDFAAKPGAANAFGLVGGDANAPGPGKRPLSSMSPTIVLARRPRVPRHRHATAAAASSPRCCRSSST